MPAFGANTAIGANGVPNFSHIFVLVMENKERGDIIGNSAAPYINQLATTYSQGANNHGVSHPSLPNYLAMISGDTWGITTDCSPTDPACSFDVPSLPDQIEAAGKIWKGYMESMPAPCSLSGTTLYDIGHDPFVYFLPIKNNTSRCNSHVVNLDQLDVDLAAGMVPNFVFITPNACHDMHNCDVSGGDQWLSGYLPRILNAPAYQQDGVLFLIWDEGTTDANTIPFVLISPLGRRGFLSNLFENHYNMLRTIEDAWGLAPLRNAGVANPMGSTSLPRLGPRRQRPARPTRRR